MHPGARRVDHFDRELVSIVAQPASDLEPKVFPSGSSSEKSYVHRGFNFSMDLEDRSILRVNSKRFSTCLGKGVQKSLYILNYDDCVVVLIVSPW